MAIIVSKPQAGAAARGAAERGAAERGPAERGPAARSAVPALRYHSGFGNEHASEALPGTLPAGQNSPQRPQHGLYAEQLSGTPFTAPRAANRRSWLYRIRPAAMHRAFHRIDNGRLGSAPFTEMAPPPNRLRWDPMALPQSAVDFVDGLLTLGGNGDVGARNGVGIHI